MIWLAAMRLGIPSCAALFAVACAGMHGETHAYKLYPGPVQDAANIAVVRLLGNTNAKFNGRPASAYDWTEVHLSPGEYTIAFTDTWTETPLLPRMVATLTLTAGHVYSLHLTGYQAIPAFQWIMDDTDEKVAAGTAPPLDD